MVFSYRVKGQYLLKNIGIPIEPAKVILLTGDENRNLGLLGGIVAGLFPVHVTESIGYLEHLVRDLHGDLEIVEGSMPESSVYLGSDPERHLLFSRVDEEVYAQTGFKNNQRTVIKRFGLTDFFLERRISTLSGGEKMRLALAIAFSRSVGCIVLHGVVPWLDARGKDKLMHEISEARRTGSCVFIIEQEVERLLPVADITLCFTDAQIKAWDTKEIIRRRTSIRRRLDIRRINTTHNPEALPLLVFDGVHFEYEKLQEGFSLRDVSFSLRNGGIYGLIGDNGAGKSTIAKIIMRLESPSSGTITFLGKNLQDIPRMDLVRRICYIGQFPEQQITLSTVEQYRKKASRTGNGLAVKLLQKYFDEERVYPIAGLSPLELKMLCIAAFISEDTRLIIFDEPTWGIDTEGERRLCGMLGEIVSHLKHLTIFIISHDRLFIKALNAHILTLDRGHISAYNESIEK
jgi:ABC-type multidrug transport system ATPase subunit